MLLKGILVSKWPFGAVVPFGMVQSHSVIGVTIWKFPKSYLLFDVFRLNI